MKTALTSQVTRFVAGLAFSVCMVTLSASAFAEPSAPSVKVGYSDLNLDNSADVKVLYSRLSAASAKVCGYVDKNILSAYTRWQVCYNHTLEQAVQQIHSPALISLYRDKKNHGTASG